MGIFNASIFNNAIFNTGAATPASAQAALAAAVGGGAFTPEDASRRRVQPNFDEEDEADVEFLLTHFW